MNLVNLDQLIDRLINLRQEIGKNVDVHFSVNQEAEFTSFVEGRELQDISIVYDMGLTSLELVL